MTAHPVDDSQTGERREESIMLMLRHRYKMYVMMEHIVRAIA